jgi:hypothetical protein
MTRGEMVSSKTYVPKLTRRGSFLKATPIWSCSDVKGRSELGRLQSREKKATHQLCEQCNARCIRSQN